MDQLQCFECGMVSNDEALIKNHMNRVHAIKVEVNDLARKFSCPSCSFTTENMEELKRHLTKEHKKDESNWMVEGIDSVFRCDECDIEFPQQSMLVNHKDNIHSTDRENKTLVDTKVENAKNQKEKRVITNVKCVSVSSKNSILFHSKCTKFMM